MKEVRGHGSMQVFVLLKLTMSNAMASGTASTMESSQMAAILTAVIVGTPLCFTRDQDATARYLRIKVVFRLYLIPPVPITASSQKGCWTPFFIYIT